MSAAASTVPDRHARRRRHPPRHGRHRITLARTFACRDCRAVAVHGIGCPALRLPASWRCGRRRRALRIPIRQPRGSRAGKGALRRCYRRQSRAPQLRHYSPAGALHVDVLRDAVCSFAKTASTQSPWEILPPVYPQLFSCGVVLRAAQPHAEAILSAASRCCSSRPTSRGPGPALAAGARRRAVEFLPHSTCSEANAASFVSVRAMRPPSQGYPSVSSHRPGSSAASWRRSGGWLAAHVGRSRASRVLRFPRGPHGDLASAIGATTDRRPRRTPSTYSFWKT